MRRWHSVASWALLLVAHPVAHAQTWTGDNGNGTYSNPLFYEEFSDPDLIRVGSEFYLTGTTMHAMPGLPILHSKDLVNWTLAGYAFDRLDLGPEARLEGGRQMYGQGIWAPSFRYAKGTFHIFANVNGHTTQHFFAKDPRGPWTRVAMKRSLHDLSVLFDDDGKTYVVWGYQEIRLAELNGDLTDIVPGTERIVIDKAAGMGEGSHFYKIDGKYYITSAWWSGKMKMPCARADRPEGPYEVNPAISIDEDFGLTRGYRLRSDSGGRFELAPPDTSSRGQMSLHQGGIVRTATGEWWGFSMMDYNSVGRLTALSPVTWRDGWPYFGLPGNLGRTPRIWVKPNTGSTAPHSAPYERNDEFNGARLANVWQWNHVPDDTKWSLTERRGFLRLHSLPAPNLWWARNTLTQRSIGPRSMPTAILEADGMQMGDVAGLALLNHPYAWIGVHRDSTGLTLEQLDETTGHTVRRPLRVARVWLRVSCDFLAEHAQFSYSLDGKTFEAFGDPFTMVFQLKTFQGVRYALFHYNGRGEPGGYVDVDAMRVAEPAHGGITRPIPVGRSVVFRALGWGRPLAIGSDSAFHIVDRRLGRVALRTSAGGWISVVADSVGSRVVVRRGEPSEAETFQWVETIYGDVALMSLATHRYLRVDPATGALNADHPGPEPGRRDGAQFGWTVAARR